ncbi:MAG: DegV family protein [Anaerolineales bacterium]|nr:DegV family protein [Anaerolineales bacterium]
MTKVAIITDSTCSMPQELIDQYDIEVVPQVVIWSDEVLEDGVDITGEEFYERLESADEMPTTSQATIASFKKAFEPLVEAEVPILAMCLADKLSGTIQSAVQAKAMFPNAQIEIYNSHTVAMALGFQVLAAARQAEKGASVEECVAAAERARERSGIVLAVDTLEYLHRGGRIGGASRFLGTALNIKPLLEVKDGRVEPLDKVRTTSKAVNRVVDIVVERLEGASGIQLATHHTGTPETAEKLREKLAGRVEADEVYSSIIPPAVGAHAGPGAYGVAYCSSG